MVIKLQSAARQHLIFILTIVLFVALFSSRVLLSATIVAFVLSSFWITGVSTLFKKFFHSPLLIFISLLFIIPLISGLWSEDHNKWLNTLRIKLPLLVLPYAFAGNFRYSSRQLIFLGGAFLMLVMMGTLWSSYFYFTDMNAVAEGYLRSISIPTPLENDHIRFSWLVAIGVLVCYWFYVTNKYRVLVAILAAWFFVYLHLLAARTGLICLYIVLAFIFIQSIKRLWIIAIIATLPVASYFLFPTFQNRVKYILYDREYFKDLHYLPGGNDANRVISIKAGWEIASDNKLIGVGFGDIRNETNAWYETHYPGMLPSDKLYPSSEWLMYGAGSGFFGVILIALLSIYPFVTRTHKNDRWWYIIGTLATFNLIFDIPLETQFGIFIYCFSLLFAQIILKSHKL